MDASLLSSSSITDDYSGNDDEDDYEFDGFLPKGKKDWNVKKGKDKKKLVLELGQNKKPPRKAKSGFRAERKMKWQDEEN